MLNKVTENIQPSGKMFLMAIPSRKYTTKLVEFFSTCDSSAFATAPTATPTSASTSTVTPATSAPATSAKEKVFLRCLNDITEPSLRKKKCRLILRNLSFQATERNITDKLSRFGPIVEVYIPKTEIRVTPNAEGDSEGKKYNRKRKHPSTTTSSGAGEGDSSSSGAAGEAGEYVKHVPRGFAFITFLCEKDALDAVQNSVGMKICNREVALDMCSSKEIHQKSLEKAAAAGSDVAEKQGGAAGDAGETDLISAHDDDDDEEADEEEGSSHTDDEQDEEELGDDASEVDSDDDEEDDMDIEDADDDDELNELNKAGSTKPNPSAAAKPVALSVVKPSDAQEKCTVFLRELAYDTTEEDIRQALVQFGRINLAILVKGKHTACPCSIHATPCIHHNRLHMYIVRILPFLTCHISISI